MNEVGEVNGGKAGLNVKILTENVGRLDFLAYTNGFVFRPSISVYSFLNFTLQDSNMLGTDDRE